MQVSNTRVFNVDMKELKRLPTGEKHGKTQTKLPPSSPRDEVSRDNIGSGWLQHNDGPCIWPTIGHLRKDNSSQH